MCGIAAILSTRDPIDPRALDRATKVLNHRGPDAQRVWVSRDGTVGLGHARLSIIDLSTGDQPLANEDERLHLVANGEFYGFEAIRGDLERLGHGFATRSDSEIALHLYEEYGTRGLHSLRGEFAFALWDEPNRTLFAARDRFGIKPLFYALHEGSLYLASEVKALFAAGVPARWNHENLYHFHTSRAMPQATTLFEGVRQVPPGHYLLFRGGHAQIHPYWDFNYPRADASTPRDPREQIEALREKLHEAVRLRLRADVPVGCYLSGGLDSCAVLGFAAEHASQPIKSFTLTFDHPEYNEHAIAREMAERVGAEFIPIEIRSKDLAEHFSDALWHAERHLINAHAVAKYLLSRTVRDHGYKVVLTGEGSDEIFAGYAHFREDMVRYNTEGQDPETATRLIEEMGRSNAVSQGILTTGGESIALDSVKSVLGFVPAWFEVSALAGRALKELLDPEFAAEYESRDAFRLWLNETDVEGRLAGREPVHQSLYLWAKSALPGYILSNLGDRMEMAHSVEGRLPFLDHPLVERVAEMPVSMKIQGMNEKYVLREASRPYITETVYRRQKHPFLSPPATHQTDEPLFDMVRETLNGPALEQQGIYDAGKVRQLLAGVAGMNDVERTRADAALMTLLSTTMLADRFAL